MDGEQQWWERTQAEEVSEGTESPLKTWGLFKGRGCGLLHMEQLLLAAFRRAVLRAASWGGGGYWDGTG